MWGTLASVAIGALGARKTAKAMQGANDLDLAKLRREAEQNGFNPLTVLRATGGQGSTKGPSGNLASGAFFQTFAQGIPSILEANYNKKMKQAQLSNINASTENLLASAKSMSGQSSANDFIQKHAVPMLVPITTGGMEGKQKVLYMGINPELMETQLSEAMGSMIVQGLQYSYQNGVPASGFTKLIKGLPPALKKSLNNIMGEFEKTGKIPTQAQITKALASEFTGQQLDRSLQQFETLIGHQRNKPKLESEPDYNSKISGVPINQQQKIMEELFP